MIFDIHIEKCDFNSHLRWLYFDYPSAHFSWAEPMRRQRFSVNAARLKGKCLHRSPHAGAVMVASLGWCALSQIAICRGDHGAQVQIDGK
ncbi:MAG: hypothetical protein ACJAVR_003926 [Paracoccaceae bacterium]|jgi:hypothetical protein